MKRRTPNNRPALIWPPLLRLPSADLCVVYLDLNHWIGLAQATVGHVSGREFKRVLEACRTFRQSGRAIFVLSGAHYCEMLKIKSPSQRESIATLMEELTGFATLLSRAAVMELELTAAVDRFAKLPTSLRSVPLVGRGVRHAFGLQSGVRIMGPSGDETASVRDRIGPDAFDAHIASVELALERSVLRGPKDAEVEQLMKHGWAPDRVLEGTETRAIQEREQAQRLSENESWRRGRLRDVVSARELAIEFQNILPRVMQERGLTLEDVGGDLNAARHLVGSMPTTDVAIELKTAWHRNRDKPWLQNDVYDIDGLALAVPYCDVVVTEKACHHALTTAGQDERMGTVLLRNLLDLPNALEQKPSKRTICPPSV